MPCWTVNSVEVAVEKMNPELLMAALESMRLNPFQTVGQISFDLGSYNIALGTFTLRTSSTAQRNVKEIKRAYSAEVVKSTAKKHNWQIKQTAPYEFEVLKR